MKDFHVLVSAHPEMVLCYLAVLPVLYWFIKNVRTLKEKIYGFLFIVAFSRGTIELLGGSTVLTGLILEGIVVLLFLRTFFLTRKKRFKLPAVWTLLAFIGISVLSYILNDMSFVQLMLFFREYLPIFLFFFVLHNSFFYRREQFFLNKLIIYLFISQIFASIIKVVILGTLAEEFIGTIANRGGSLTTILALLGGTYCIAGYLLTARKKYVYGIIGFVVFSMTGSKRGTIAYLPLLYLIALYFFNRLFLNKRIKLFKKGFMAVCIIGFMVYVTARIVPSLNPEGIVGGSFDIEHVIDYSTEYVKGEDSAINSIGRAEAPAYVIDLLLDENVATTLLGFGAGSLIKSSYNEATEGQSSSEITKSRYGVGYSARTGFIQMLLQVGFLGVIFYSLFFIILLKRITKIKPKWLNDKQRILYLTVILIIFTVFIDYFTYSTVVTHIGALSLSYMWFVSRIFKIESSK